VRASVIEASVKAGRGATASVIVETGTLKRGQAFICGPFAGKVKLLVNDQGEQVKEAGPGKPVEVLGFAELPNVGDSLVGMDSERAAKKLSEERLEEKRKQRLVQPRKSRLEDMLQTVSGGGKTQLKLILRTDVQGTAEAIKNAITDIESDKVEANFLIAGAGAINESDVLMASSADAIILGFNVKVDGKAVKAAKAEGVQVKLYSIVYELIDQVKESMLGLLDPEIRETVIGRALVKQVFRVNKGRAAGCVIKSGRVSRTAHARVLRGKQPVFDGKMSTLRRHTEEVEEVKEGIECGIRLGSFNEYEEGDIIECYTLDKIDQTL
jgi:translation initiation factor IF-2